MLALLAVLVFSPARILPDPFLPTRLEPILPVPLLASVPRAAVTRGGNWRPGGLVRMNYYYRFPIGEGPTHENFLALDGFVAEVGFGGTPRAVREVDGVRQFITVSRIDDGVRWRWANVAGPCRLVTVSEFPLTPARWHHIPQLEKPPLPPGYPPNFAFLKDTELYAVYADPLIPRGFRTSFGIIVRVVGYRPLEDIWSEAAEELQMPDWKHFDTKTSRHFTREKQDYGLVKVEFFNPTVPNSKHLYEISLTYLFTDPANGPRIEL